MKPTHLQKLLPKGSVLVFSLLVLSILLVTSLTILSSALLDRKASLSTSGSTRSFQVADSGVEVVLHQVYKVNPASLNTLATNLGATCDAGTIKFDVAGGEATILFYQDETTLFTDCASGNWRDQVVKIKSEGTAGSNARAVEVAVAATGGGVTGGCMAAWNGGTNYRIEYKWGAGCKNNNTALPSSDPDACDDAADTGYSCGPVSGGWDSTTGGEPVYCSCVSN